jgi:SWI/SNF-related matrix-associated actin-dependent regulator of chromatin subfamily A3
MAWYKTATLQGAC